MKRWTNGPVLTSTLALLFSSAISTVARAGECELIRPDTIDRGLVQTLGLRCDDSFVGVLQLSTDQAFTTPITMAAQASEPGGGAHETGVTFRTPWDIEDFLDRLFVRGFALTSSGQLHATGVVQLDVGTGDRVFESVTAGRGLLAIEMESEQIVEDWEESRYYDGYSGEAYILWKGSDHYNDKNHGVIEYHFEVTRPGEYALALHCFHWGGHLNNDVWMKFDNHSWEKVYSAAEGVWSWRAEKEGGSTFKEYLGAGRHKLTIAARSQRFCMDRMHLFNTGDYSRSEVEDLSIPLSKHHYE